MKILLYMMLAVINPKVKELFFKAPIENFDSTTFNFFKQDSSFRYQEKKGDWSAIDRGVTITSQLYFFYFDQHPVINARFDTGRIIFAYSHRRGDQELVYLSFIIYQQ